MFLSAHRRVTALAFAVLLAGAPVLPLALCVCAPSPMHDGCQDPTNTALTLTCCCDGDTPAPIPNAATPGAVTTGAPSPALFTPVTALAAPAGMPEVVDAPSPTLRARPLFKLFSAFLI